jgi:hypothetical protein
MNLSLKEKNMRQAVLIFAVCGTAMLFAISCASSSFTASMDEVVLDSGLEGVLGYFDIEVKIPKPPSGLNLSSDNPEIIAAIEREIVKLGGTRAVNVHIDGRKTFGNITARVIGTVVR